MQLRDSCVESWGYTVSLYSPLSGADFSQSSQGFDIRIDDCLSYPPHNEIVRLDGASLGRKAWLKTGRPLCYMREKSSKRRLGYLAKG